ncbi:MAG: cutinase family protein [Corynebacterium sp.]|nr:cutinase family protein [Corynebacterium sp.]
MNKRVQYIGSILAALFMVFSVTPARAADIADLFNETQADILRASGSSAALPEYPKLHSVDQVLSPEQRCGTNLALIVRGSNENPSGDEQPNLLTYQQIGTDLWGDSNYQMARKRLHGGGYLGQGYVRAVSSVPVATLVYPASKITIAGGPEVGTDTYRNSVAKGADQLTAALHTIFDACGDNPPHLILAGYSQGADVINTVTSRLMNTPDVYLLERVRKILLLGDPSRRANGAENTDAWIRGIPTNSIGGVSRAVTAGTPYVLSYPTLDQYRDTHQGQIASYCVAGDLVCDTHSGESLQGVEVHTSYANTVSHITNPDIRQRYNVQNNAQYLDVLWSQGLDALGIQNPIADNSVAVVGPGLNYMSISESIRDTTKSQKVRVRGTAYNGQVFEGVGTIGAGASGAFSYFLPLAFPMGVDLEVYLDDNLIARMPAIYSYANKAKDTEVRGRSVIVIQGDHDYDRPMGDLLMNQIQNWGIPLEQRIEVIRSVYGDIGVHWYYAWLNFVHAAGVRVDYADQLNQLFDQGRIPAADEDMSKDFNTITNALHEWGLMDDRGNINIGGIDLVRFLDIFVLTN